MHFLTDMTWWGQAIVQIIAGAILLSFWGKFKIVFLRKIITPFSKRGFIGQLARKQQLKRLLKIKNILKDELKINKEVIKQYAYLSTFLLSIIIYFCLLISLTISSKDFRVVSNQYPISFNVVFFVIASPIYIFELLYINQQAFVEKIFKFRK